MEVLISQDTRYKRKDGSYAIILRLSGNEQTLPIATGYFVTKQYWDADKRQIKKGYGGYDSISRVNNLLADKRNIARKVITTLEENGELENLTIHEIRNRILSVFRKPDATHLIDKLRKQKIIANDKKKKELLKYLDEIVESGKLAEIPLKDIKEHFQEKISSNSVFTFLDKIQKDLIEIDKVGNAAVYKCLSGVLRNFVGEDKDLSFDQLDYQFLQNMEKWHLKKGLKINGLGTYLRTLRSTYNKAVKAGLAERDSNPFYEYKIKKEDTAKRAISEDYILRIMNLELEEENSLFTSRNYFLASFAMHGMSFIDLAFLKKRFIYDGRIRYKRTKNSRAYNVKLNELLQSIIDYYAKDKGLDDFIFPVIKRESIGERYKDVKQARKMYNKELKQIARKCDIEESLTSYVARHSFAMSARMSSVPIEVISQMLGHKDTKTTLIYLNSIPDKTVDDYADKVLSMMTQSKE